MRGTWLTVVRVLPCIVSVVVVVGCGGRGHGRVLFCRLVLINRAVVKTKTKNERLHLHIVTAEAQRRRRVCAYPPMLPPSRLRSHGSPHFSLCPIVVCKVLQVLIFPCQVTKIAAFSLCLNIVRKVLLVVSMIVLYLVQNVLSLFFFPVAVVLLLPLVATAEIASKQLKLKNQPTNQ